MPKTLVEHAGVGAASCWVCLLEPEVRKQVVDGANNAIGVNRIAHWLFDEYGITIATSTSTRGRLTKHIREKHDEANAKSPAAR